MGIRLSLRARMQLIVVSVVLLGFAATIAVLVDRAGVFQRDTAQKYAEQLARHEADRVARQMNTALNAALVEGAAASAQVLEQEARKLMDAVSVFRVEGPSSSAEHVIAPKISPETVIGAPRLAG